MRRATRGTGAGGLAPVNTVAPVISGTMSVGQTLSCTEGTWIGAPAPTFSYQWQRGGVNIGGAQASTYVLTGPDLAGGPDITCDVTATNAVDSDTATSNTLAGVAPVNTVAPVVSGTMLIDQVLSCTEGTWTGSPTILFTYQWTLGGADITGETASTYTLVTASFDGTDIGCDVKATNDVTDTTQASNTLTFDPSDVATMLVDLRADVDVTITGLGVSSWIEAVASKDFVQGTDADRPAKVTTSFGGANGIEFDKSNTEDLLTASGAIVSAATSYTCIAAVDALSQTTQQTLLDAQTGRLRFGLRAVGASMDIFDGASQALATLTLGEQILTFIANDGTGTEILREELSLATDTYAAKSWGGVTGLGANFNSSAEMDAVLRALFLYASALTTPQQATIRAWMSADSGISVWDPTQLPGLFASYFGFQGKTLVGSDVDVWADQTSGGTPSGSQDLTATAAGTRPAETLASALMGGQDTLAFDGGDRIRGDTAADWTTIHDGTGGSYAFIFHSTQAGAGNQILGDDNNLNASGVGHHCYYQGNNQRIICAAKNGSTSVYSFVSGNGTVTVNATHILVVRYKEGRSPKEWDVRLDGVELGSGDSDAAPSLSDAAFALALGSTAFTAGSFLTGELGLTLYASEVWTDAVCALLETWSTRYGVVLP